MPTKRSKGPTRSAEGRTFMSSTLGQRFPVGGHVMQNEVKRRRAAKTEAAKETVRKSTKAYKRTEAISRKVSKTTPKSSLSKIKSSKGMSR